MSEPARLDAARFLAELVELLARRVVELQAERAQAESAGEERSPWLSLKSAACYLDFPAQRLYKLCASGAIPHYKQAGRLLFHREELDEWLRAHAQGPARRRLDAGGDESYV